MKPTEPVKPAEPAGKPTRVDGVGGGGSFEITLPPDVKVTVDPGGDEQLPTAKFEGAGLSFQVDTPEAWPEVGFTLAAEKGILDRSSEKVTYERTDDRGDTWTMIYKRPAQGTNAASYAVEVAYRTATLKCAAYQIDTREHADRIAAICETLRPVAAPPPSPSAEPTKKKSK